MPPPAVEEPAEIPEVADASVIAPFVADAGPDGDTFRTRLRGEIIAGPDLLRIEVMSVIRRQTGVGALTRIQANRAVENLLELPLTVYPASAMLRRAWALRHNMTTYDAC